jgi:hypothetical protein
MQNAVCRRNHTFKRSADQGFKTRMNPARKQGGSARSIWRSAGRPSSYQIYSAGTRAGLRLFRTAAGTAMFGAAPSPLPQHTKYRRWPRRIFFYAMMVTTC